MSEENKDYSYFTCHSIGLAGTTPVTLRRDSNGFTARMGVAIFGTTNMDEEGFEKCGGNPFHSEFHDNYVEGSGLTEDEAIKAMEKDYWNMHESLWY